MADHGQNQPIAPGNGSQTMGPQLTAAALWTQATNDSYPQWLPNPDPTLIYTVPPRPTNLQERQRQWRETQLAAMGPRTVYNPVPDTPEYYASKNAIEQPTSNVKPEDGSCLTCIYRVTRCHGTELVNGRCACCQGLDEHGTRVKKSRACRWKDTNAGIFTYRQHQAATNATRIQRNTTEGRARIREQRLNEQGIGNNADEFMDIWDLPEGYGRQLVRAMFATLVDGGWASKDPAANTDALLSLAETHSDFVLANPLNFANTQVFLAVAMALDDIIIRLNNMKRLGHLLRYESIIRALPAGHPDLT